MITSGIVASVSVTSTDGFQKVLLRINKLAQCPENLQACGIKATYWIASVKLSGHGRWTDVCLRRVIGLSFTVATGRADRGAKAARGLDVVAFGLTRAAEAASLQ